MKAAFAQWDNRVAPVFDFARQMRTVESISGEVVEEVHALLPDELPVQKALRIAELGVDTLVCGAISRSLYEVICSYGVRVVPFVTGELREVINAWLKGDLERDIYAMPGCWGRGRARSRQDNQSNRNEQEEYLMNRGGGGGMGRGGGGGRGQGRGQGGMRGGRMGGAMGGGPGGNCVCPKCGHEESHSRGVPCMEMKCPKCGSQMVRG